MDGQHPNVLFLQSEASESPLTLIHRETIDQNRSLVREKERKREKLVGVLAMATTGKVITCKGISLFSFNVIQYH